MRRVNDPIEAAPQSHDLDNDPAVPVDTGADVDDDVSPTGHESIDLDAIEADLTDVQTALERLNDGTYWTDEVTGETIPDDVLAAHPTARSVSPTLT